MADTRVDICFSSIYECTDYNWICSTVKQKFYYEDNKYNGTVYNIIIYQKKYWSYLGL